MHHGGVEWEAALQGAQGRSEVAPDESVEVRGEGARVLCPLGSAYATDAHV